MVRYDPLVLGFVEAAPGAMVVQAGGRLAAPRVDPVVGRIDVVVEFDKPVAMAQTEPLVALTFAAKTARAQTQLVASPIDVKGEDGNVLQLPRPTPLRLKTTP